MAYKASVNLINKPGNLKGIASVSVNDEFAVRGLRIYEGENGLFVSMPSRKTENGYEEICFPTTRESREALHSAVLEAYEYKLSQQEEQTNEKGKETKKTGKKQSQKRSDEHNGDKHTAEATEEQDEQTETAPEMSM